MTDAHGLREPSEAFGAVDEDGYHVTAYAPASDSERLEWRLVAQRGEEVVATKTAPMLHPPRFGYDVDDLRTLEDLTQELLDELRARR